MSTAAWIVALTDAARHAVQLAKVLGLPSLLPDEVGKVKEAVNAALDEVLPLAIVGVAVGAVHVAEEKLDQIDSLGKAPVCPMCGSVVRQVIEKYPHTDVVKRTESCDGCGWTS